MSNQGRALISALNRGDYQAVDQYSDLSDQDIKIVNHHVHELFERAISTENFKLFLSLIKIPRVRVSGPEYCAMRHATRQSLVEFVSEIVRVPSANPNLRDKEGNTAMMYAVRGKWSEKKALDLVRAILLTGQVRLNLKGGDHKTPLHLAMEKDWFEVANTLVDAGAHPKVEDKDGQTPLGIALKSGDFDLFQKMLAFEGDPPEEEADDPSALDAADDNTPQANANDPAPATGNPPQQDPNGAPTIQKVDTSVTPMGKDDDVPIIHRQPPATAPTPDPQPTQIPPPITAAPRQSIADTANFNAVMEEQELDETLTKHFFFTPAEDDKRIRLHRRAILEKLPDIQKVLTTNNNALNATDFAKKDAESGLNFWHVAALEGHFEQAVRLLMESGDFPTPADLAALSPGGKGIASILDENSALQSVLGSDMWEGKTQQMAAFLSGLPSSRKTAFGGLIARTNLAMMHGG